MEDKDKKNSLIESTSNIPSMEMKITTYDLMNFDSDEIRTIEREIELFKKSQSPYILKILESTLILDQFEKILLIFNDSHETSELKSIIRDRLGLHFTENLILKWLRQISLAIKEIHSLDIIHKNINSSSVLVDEYGDIKVSYFGIWDKHNSLLNKRNILYVSPEVIKGASYTKKSDIWLIGVILYELCNLQTLFNNDNENNIEPEPIYSNKLTSLIKSLLENDPEKRPDIDDILELIDDKGINYKYSLEYSYDEYDYSDFYESIDDESSLEIYVDRFEGQWDEGKKHGQGKMNYFYGDSYIGEWNKDSRDGYGIYYYNNGDRYEGEWKNDKLHGLGIIYYNNGDRYEGGFYEGNLHGNAITYYNNGDRYEGESNEEITEGYGITYYNNGDRYEGEFLDSSLNGYGTYYYNNGDRYEGEWNEEMTHGYGIMYYNNGDNYEGEWNEYMTDGYGKRSYNNGDYYEGEWKDNKYHGKGIKRYKEGDTYEGKWKYGEFHGYGVYEKSWEYSKNEYYNHWMGFTKYTDS